MLPKENFLIVENWKDSPSYKVPFKNIQFRSFENDVKLIYEETKILLVLSLIEEAFGRVIIESLLNGIPVVAHDIGGIPEACLGLGFLVKPLSVVDDNLNISSNITELSTHCEEIIKKIDFVNSSNFRKSSFASKSKSKSLEYVSNARVEVLRVFNEILVDEE